MTEVEKLYKNAGFKKDLLINLADLDFSEEDCDELCLDNSCDECRYKTFPPLTAEKQLKLIDFLSKYEITIINESNTPDYVIYTYEKFGSVSANNIGELMAKYINMFIWRNLTEEEQQQIKEILK